MDSEVSKLRVTILLQRRVPVHPISSRIEPALKRRLTRPDYPPPRDAPQTRPDRRC
jgi:hypothetical protein